MNVTTATQAPVYLSVDDLVPHPENPRICPLQNRTSSIPTSGSLLKHSAAGYFRLGSYPCSVCGHSISRIESCLCFSSHGYLSAGTFTPRELAASSLNQFPSHCRGAV